jgi:hypothetical protein
VGCEAARLTTAGATELRTLQQEETDHFAVVMQDPEGNGFCPHQGDATWHPGHTW